MPFGDFESPDGRIARFEFPEGTTPEQAQEAMAGFDWNSLPKPSAMGAVKRGALNTYDLVSKALPGVAGSALGFDEYGGRKLQEAVSSMQDTAAQYPAKYESFDEVDSLGEFGGYATEAFLENVVSIIPSIATGGIGGIAAKGAIKQAAATAMANAAKAGATKEAAEAAAISAAKSAALKYQAAGAFAGSAAQNIPDSGVNLYAETGEVNPYAAIGTGLGKAALDAVLPTKLLQSGNVVGKPLGRVARGLGEGLVTEGVTEGTQQAMDQAAVSAITGDPFLTPENLKNVKEAAIKGGIAGGGMSAITSGVFGKSAPSRTPPVIPKTSAADEPDETPSVPAATPPPSPIEPGGIVQMGTYRYPIVAVDVAGQTATLYNDGSDGTEPGNQEVPIADIAPLVRKPSTAPVTPVTPVTPPTATQPTPAPKPMYTPPAKTEVAPPTTKKVTTPINSMEIDVEPELVELGDLRASDAKDYPANRQPRDRTSKRSEAQITELLPKFDPQRLGDSPTTDQGAPIIGPEAENYVESGNGRVMLLRRAYDNPETAEKYKSYLASQGYDVSQMKQPVLVRRRRTQLDDAGLSKFVEDSNKSSLMAQNETELAAQDARRLTPEIVDLYRGGSMQAGANSEFRRAVMRDVIGSETEAAGLRDKDGNLSQAGENRVRAALFQYGYNDLNAVENFFTSSDPELKSIGDVMQDLAPNYASARANLQKNSIDSKYDIAKNITDALAIIRKARDRGERISDQLNQMQLIGDSDVDPVTERIVRGLFNKDLSRVASKKAMDTFLRGYADKVRNYDPNQSDVFGDATLPEPTQILDSLLAARDAKGGEQPKMNLPSAKKMLVEEARRRIAPKASSKSEASKLPAQIDLMDLLREKDSQLSAALEKEAKAIVDGGNQEQAVRRFELAARQETAKAPAKVQTTLPGTEKKLSDRELAEKKMNEPKRSAKRQDTDGFGLFDDGAPKQIDLEDAIATKKKSSGKSEASVLPKSEVSNEPTVDLKGRTSEDFTKTNRPSYRPQMYEAMGLDPAKAVNMAPEKIIEKAKPLFKNTFDIDIVVDPKANFGKVIDNLADAYVTFQYFAYSLGIDNKALGLSSVKITPSGTAPGNSLKLEFKKSSGANLGLYNPASKKITIPDRANSFAHEWAHALDYHVLDALGGNEGMEKAFRGFSGRTREKGAAGFEPKSVADAWINLMNTLFFDDAELAAKVMELEKKYERAKTPKIKEGYQKQLDKIANGNYRGRGIYSATQKAAKLLPGDKQYWTRPTEMLARAFEAYTASRISEFGGKTEMLSRENIGYLSTADKYIAGMYPQLAERSRIFLAIDQMMQAVNQAQILKTGNLNETNIANMVSAEEKLWPLLAQEREEKSVVERMREYYGEDSREARKQAAKTMRAEKEARPTNPNSIIRVAGDVARSALSSSRTYLRAIYARNPRTDMDNVLKAIATNPGSGVPQPGTYWYTVSRITNKYTAKLERIVNAYDADSKNPDERKFLWNAVQGLEQDVKLKPEREKALTKAAAEMRERIFQEMVYELGRAGIDVRYLKDVGYLPQVFDMPLIQSNRDAAIKDFAESYKDTMIYDRDRGQLDVNEFIDLAEMALGSGDERVKALKEAALDATDGKEIVMTDELEATIDVLFDEVNELTAPGRAEVLMEKLTIGGDFTPDVSASAAFLKPRSFAPTTLKRLAKWRLNNPVEVTQNYITRAARAAAWNEHFGKLNEWKKDAYEKNFNPEDLQTILNTLDLLTGRNRIKEARSAHNLLNRTLSHLTAMLLGRSVFASLAEYHVAPLRTGRVRDGYRNMYSTIKSILGDKDMKKAREMLEISGVLESAMADSITAERMGGSYDLDPNTQKFMSRFMENNLVAGLTRHQFVGAAVTGARFFKDMAKIVTGREGKALLESTTPESARAFFRDMGIEKGKERKFAEYVLSLDDLLPPIEDVGGGKDESPNAAQFMRALNTFTTQVQQRPTAVDRPKWANTPYGRWVYALNTFNFAFWDNAIKSNAAYFKRVNAEKGVAKAAMMTAAKFLPAYANYVMWMGMFFMLRTMLFAGEKWEEMDDDEKFNYILKGAISYSLPLGPAADVAYQSFESVKYEKDLTSLTAGGPLGAMLSDVQAIMRSYQKNSEDTNTAERARVKAAYDLTVLPAVTQLMGMIPGPAGKVAGVAGAFATSGAAKDKAADIIAGEKEE